MDTDDLDDYITGFNNDALGALTSKYILAENATLTKEWGMVVRRHYYVVHDGVAVGVVTPTDGADIILYMKKEYRGQGLLSSALEETIFPHLFSECGISELRATSKNPEVEDILSWLGFDKAGDGYYLNKKNVRSFDDPVICEPFTGEQIDRLRREVNRLSRQMGYVSDLLNQHSACKSLAKCFNEIHQQVDNLSLDISDKRSEIVARKT